MRELHNIVCRVLHPHTRKLLVFLLVQVQLLLQKYTPLTSSSSDEQELNGHAKVVEIQLRLHIYKLLA